ncbi:hypothetical protein JCM5350_002081 [Sporobolomyces pararoseus]
MDRVPFELLVHISECLSLEPLPQLRQGSLAKLSRSNKTLHNATQPILYRDPVLLSDWRAKCYEKTIGKKVDPWVLSGSRRKEKRWWMPRKIGFYNFGPRNCPRFKALSSDVVWSNLTSLKFRNCSVNQFFLATVLGPRHSLRHTIVSLDYPDSFTDYLLFLFDVAHFLKSVEYLFIRYIKTGVDYPSDDEENQLEGWARHEGVQHDYGAWSDEPLPEHLKERARFDFIVWSDFFDQELLWEIENATLATIIHSSRPSEYPFSALSFLSLRIAVEAGYHLIFYTSLFPSLRVLVLQSTEAFETIEPLDQATLRYSLTHENGSGALIGEDDEIRLRFEPLSEVEERDYPLKPYRGPHLSDLECWDLP